MTVSTFQQLHDFVDDLGRTLDTRVDPIEGCRDAILCGMGGSAITSDVVADVCFPRSPVPVHVVKGPVLPSWAGEGTLAVVSSYSGNTAETIEMYRSAVERGCKTICITSGGKLRDIAGRDGNRAMPLPAGLHPRHSIGYMIGYTLAIMRAAGCPDVSEEIRGLLPSLREYRDILEASDSPAYALAGMYMDHVPVVCAESGLGSAVLRWKTQFNENSKYIAFCSTVPDFRYGGLGPWTGPGLGNYVFTMLLSHDALQGPRKASVDAVRRALREAGRDFGEIVLGGSSELEDRFRAIMLGDYTSIYMADMRGIDSAEVRPVMLMKERLGTSFHPRS